MPRSVRRRWRALGAVIAAAGLLAGAGLALHRARADTAPLTRAPDGRPLVMTFSETFGHAAPAPPGIWAGDHLWRTTFGDGSKGDLSSRTIKSNKELELYVDPSLADPAGR